MDIFPTHVVIQFLGTPHAQNRNQDNSTYGRIGLRRNPPDVGVTSGQKSCTKIIHIVLQTSVGLS